MGGGAKAMLNGLDPVAQLLCKATTGVRAIDGCADSLEIVDDIGDAAGVQCQELRRLW